MRHSYAAIIIWCLSVCSFIHAHEPSKVDVRFRASPTDDSLCGVDCLYVSLRMCGDTDLKLRDLEHSLPPGPHGLSVDQLVQFARKRSHLTSVVRTDLGGLRSCSVPMILHVDKSHFIVLVRFAGERLVIFDNVTGLFECAAEWFSRRYSWEGVAIMFGPPSPEALFSQHWLAILSVCFLVAGISAWLFWRLQGRTCATIETSNLR